MVDAVIWLTIERSSFRIPTDRFEETMRAIPRRTDMQILSMCAPTQEEEDWYRCIPLGGVVPISQRTGITTSRFQVTPPPPLLLYRVKRLALFNLRSIVFRKIPVGSHFNYVASLSYFTCNNN